MKNKTIKKLEKLIEEYVKPVDYSLKCKGCRIGLAQLMYEELMELKTIYIPLKNRRQKCLR